MSKKRKRVLWLVVLLLILVFVLNIVTGLWNKQDKEWGVSLEVTNVTPSGASYELKQEDCAYAGFLTTGDLCWVQKRSFFHWTYMDESLFSNAFAYRFDEDKPFQGKLDFEWRYEKLPMGMYRLEKQVSMDDEHRNFYDVFFVITWQGILWCVLAIVVTVGLLWAILRFRFDIKVKEFIKKIIHMERKKRVFIGVPIVCVLIFIWILFVELQGPIANGMKHIKIQIAESLNEELTGTLSFTNSKDIAKMRRGLGYVEKRTLWGWKEIGRYRGKSNPYELLEIEEQDFSYNWELYKIPISEGRYRIRYKVDRLENGEWKRNGYYYIMFSVE